MRLFAALAILAAFTVVYGTDGKLLLSISDSFCHATYHRYYELI